MKCILCGNEISWDATLLPMSYLQGHDNNLIERYCPKCWNRIWSEWYVYGDDGIMDLRVDVPNTEYILAKYKGNNFVGKIEGVSLAELRNKETKVKKHWWF